MNRNPIQLTKISIFQVDTANKIRQSNISGFKQPIFCGVHGGVKQFFGVEPEIEYPSTLDHTVIEAGG